MTDEEAKRIRFLAESLMGMTIRQAADLQKDLSRQPAPPSQDCNMAARLTVEDLRLWKAARCELRRRSVRSHYVPSSLLGEGGWNILLDLFDSKMRQREVSVTSACLAADVPTTTALRYLKILEVRDLVRRKPHATDARRQIVELTVKGEASLRSLLLKLVEIEESVSAEIEVVNG